MSRRKKLILLLVGAPILLLIVLFVAVLTPAVQTFAARQALSGQGSVERVSVGSSGAEIAGLVIEQPGVKISVPSLKADLPMFGLAGGAIDLRSLVLHDIVIDYDPVAAALHAAQNPPAAEAAAPARPFEGVLRALQLPAMTVDGVDLAGVVRVAGPVPIAADFTLKGGGVAAGKEGRLELKVVAQGGEASAGSVVLALLPTLDAGGQISALTVVLDATAKGLFQGKANSLRSEIAITRAEAGESYVVKMIAADKALVEINSRWEPGATKLSAGWRLDITDADVKPFVPVPLFALPEFKLSGAGDVRLVDAGRLETTGDLRVVVDGLETLGLPALGRILVTSRFDVAGSATEAKVNTFAFDVASADAPVLGISARQPFSYEIATNKITASRSDADLLNVRLLGVPSAWVAAFVPELTLAGPLTGEWTVRPDADDIVVDSAAPFVITGLRYGPAAAPLVAFDSVNIEGLRVRQGPAGLDAVIGKIRVVAAAKELLTLKLAANQKTGSPLVVHSEISTQLALLADQPALRGQTRLSAGRALLVVDASVAAASRVTADLRLSGLRAAGAGDLPEVVVLAELDQAVDGGLTVKLPLSITGLAPKRTSDLELSATAASSPDATGKATWQVAAKLLSQTLHLPDLQAFAALASDTLPAPAPESKPAETPAPADAPLWDGVTGALDISLARIVYAPGIEVLDTKGRVALTKEAISLEKFGLLLGTGGGIDLVGALRWLATDKKYALSAEAKGADLAAGPLLKALNPAASVPLEGTYAFSAKLAGEGIDPATAAAGAAADFNLTGKAGVIRSLNFETNKYARAGSAVVGGLAGLAGAFTGNPEVAKQASYVTAINNVVRRMAALPYDELIVSARRDASGAVQIGEFRLQSPSIRASGSGGFGNLPGVSLVHQPFNLKLDLGAREELARDFVTLGLAEPLPIEAAPGTYAALTEPVVLDDTLAKIGTDQFMRLLVRKLGAR
jgi:hypothetical protein